MKKRKGENSIDEKGVDNQRVTYLHVLFGSRFWYEEKKGREQY